MAESQNEGFIMKDLGWVTELGNPSDPQSITWVNFPAVQFGDMEPADAGSNGQEYSVPVSTSEILDSGVELVPDAQGMIFFWATVNVTSARRGDVKPRNFESTLTVIEEANEA